MANTYTIGPVNSTGTLGGAYQGRIDLSETVDASNNQSVIAWSFNIWANGESNYRYQNTNNVTVVINGETEVNTSNIGTVALNGTSSASPFTLCSGTINVPHNSDGTKTLAVSAIYRQNNASYLQTIPINGSVTLEYIPRSEIFSSVPNVTISATNTTDHTTTWTAKTGHYYKVEYFMYVYVAPHVPGEKVQRRQSPKHTSAVLSGGTYTYAIPSSWGSDFEGDSKAREYYAVLHTYSDSSATNELGTWQAAFSATLGDSFKPTISSSSYSHQSTVSTMVLSGKTYDTVTFSASYSGSATLKTAYAVYIDANDNELGDRAYGTSPITMKAIPAFGDTSKAIRIKLGVTDTRGMTTENVVGSAFTAYGWTSPTVSSVSAYRCTSAGVADMFGGYYKVTFTYSVRSMNNANAKNVAIKYRWLNAVTYTTSSSGAVTNYSGTLTLGPYTLSNVQDEKLEIRVEVADSVTAVPASASYIILPGTVFIDILTDDEQKVGLAVGMTSTKQGAVQLGWPLEVNNANDHVRGELSADTGLTFYDSNGNEIGNYPPDGSVIDLDSSLTVQDAAADAKAVGDALATIQAKVGAPLVASNASQMTDQTKIYVYTGSQTGYTAGNWYYYSGTAWVSGGVYNSSAVQLDSSLSILGVAADAKAVGDRFEAIENLEDLALSYNLELGGINSSGHEFGAGDGTYMRTPEYIPMETAQYMQFPSKGDPTGKALFVCYYNSNKAFVTRVQTVTDYAIDTQYAYIRLSFYMSSGNNESVYRTWVNWNVPSELVDTVNDMSAIVTGLVNTVQDISDEVNAIENLENVGCAYRLELGGINSSGQEFGENDGTYMRTPDFINMDKAQYMEFPSKGDPTGKALFICYYNSSKQFVTRVQTTTGYKLVTSYPYIRLSFYMSTGNNESVYRTWVNWDVPNRLTDTAKASFWYEYDSNTKTLTITGTKAKYIIKRVTDNSIHLDSWRLYAGYVLVGSNWFNMWTNSDAEGPIKIDNESDFISGYHGDEIYQSATLYIDNVPLNVSADESGRAESFMLCQTSTCYRVNSNTQAFTRYKKVSIQDNSFTVQQRWVAKVSCTVTRGALCLMQCYEDELVGWDTDLLLPMQSYTTSASLSKDTRIGNLYLNGGRKLSLIAERGADNEYFYPSANYYQDQSRVKYYFDMYNGKSLSIGDELISKFTVRVDDYSV